MRMWSARDGVSPCVAAKAEWVGLHAAAVDRAARQRFVWHVLLDAVVGLGRTAAVPRAVTLALYTDNFRLP